MMTDAERRSCFVHVVTEYKELLLQDGIDYSSFSPHECRLILDRMNQLNTTTAQQFGLKDEAVSLAPLKLISDTPAELPPSTQQKFTSFIAVSYCWHSKDWKPAEGFHQDRFSDLPISRPMYENIL